MKEEIEKIILRMENLERCLGHLLAEKSNDWNHDALEEVRYLLHHAKRDLIGANHTLEDIDEQHLLEWGARILNGEEKVA